MPLIVPGLQGNDAANASSTDGNNPQQWMMKMAGKKLGEQNNETVCGLSALDCWNVLADDNMTDVCKG